MKLNKKILILYLILIGILVLGGTTYGIINHKQTQAKIETAKVELTEIQESLTALLDQLASYELEGGYISNEMTQETLDGVKTALNSLTESSVVYEVKDEDVESKLEVVKTGKVQVEQEIDRLTVKLNIQDSVNNLFEGIVIDQDEVTNLAIQTELTEDEATEVETKLEGSDEWSQSLLSLVTDAKEQLDHIIVATDAVNELHEDGEVIDKPSRDTYESVVSIVNDVKNDTIREGFEAQLKGVLTVIVAKEEEEARLLAEAKAEAERIAQAEAQRVTSSSSGGNGGSTGDKANSTGTTTASTSTGSKSNRSSANLAKDSNKTYIVEADEMEFLGEYDIVGQDRTYIHRKLKDDSTVDVTHWVTLSEE